MTHTDVYEMIAGPLPRIPSFVFFSWGTDQVVKDTSRDLQSLILPGQPRPIFSFPVIVFVCAAKSKEKTLIPPKSSALRGVYTASALLLCLLFNLP